MAATVFEAATTVEALRAGWQRVRANAGGPGGDGVTAREFAATLSHRLVRLHVELRDGGYVPGPLRRVEIPKPSGGTRPLAIPCVVDRVAQTAVAQALTPILETEFEESSFGYRPGRSVHRAADRIALLRRQGYGWVVDGDIERHFETVPHDRLLARLARSVPDARLLDLIERWLDGFGDGRGLPQGSPISPLLSNLYLDEIDERIARHGVHLVRFADDFVILCRSEAAASGALARMAALLSEFGLRLDPDKTRIVSFDEGFQFLGRLFVRGLALDAPAEDRVDTGPPEAAMAGDPLDGGVGEGGAGLRPLYVHEAGRTLDLRNQSFAVREGGTELVAIAPGQVGRIELGPQVGLTDAAMRHAVLNAVPVALVNGVGETVGRIEAPGVGRAALHLAQARTALDPDRRLALARLIGTARVQNQRGLLKRLNRRRKLPAVETACDALARVLRRMPHAPAVDMLMGYEGQGAALYWPALGACLEHGWTLKRRHRDPPPDPANMLLNWLCRLVLRDVRAAILAHGLHPGFGCLHTPDDGEDACAHDLVEELRAPLAEAVVVYLLNNRMVSPDMFSRLDGGGWRIDPEGRRVVIRTYEAWLDRPVKSPRGGNAVGWRVLMREQAEAYAAHCRGEETYRPYRVDY